jgi:hypothetical protein
MDRFVHKYQHRVLPRSDYQHREKIDQRVIKALRHCDRRENHGPLERDMQTASTRRQDR